MSANQALEFSKVPFRDSRYYSYTVAEGVANSVAEMLAETIGEQDPALLAMLHRELRTVREWIIGNRTHPKKIFDKLQEIHRQIAEFQHRGVGNAAEKLHEQAAEFVDVIAQHEARLLDKLLNEREIRRRTLKTLLTDTEIKNMLNYKPFVDGRTIGQWFSKLEFDNASAIFNAVQKGVVNGMTLNSIMQVIQGRQTPQGWEPGILDRNRRSAETLARTVINATANQSRLEMYQANADVIDGVQWRSTLDHRTCMICGAYDGKIWTPDKMSEVKVPPAHPSCRCVLLPYIDVDLGGTRPAEAENFDLMAKEKYEAKYEGKKYDDLSYEYRRRLRYKAIEEYTQSGKEPYKQVSGGTTFADYLKGQSDEFQREWLGRTRFELYKAGKLPMEYMVKPDSGYRYSLEQLQREYGVDISPHEQRTRKYFEKSQMKAGIYDNEETTAILDYSKSGVARRINGYLRTGKPSLNKEDMARIESLRAAMEKFTIDQDIVVYRGVPEYSWLFDEKWFDEKWREENPEVVMKKQWSGFVSSTINRHIAGNYSEYAKDSAVIELVVPKGTHGIMMGTDKLSVAHRKDKEFLLPENTEIQVVSIDKKHNGYYVKAKVVN